MSIIGLLFIFAVFLLGFGLLTHFNTKQNLMEKIGLSFGLGLIVVFSISQLTFIFGLPMVFSQFIFLFTLLIFTRNIQYKGVNLEAKNISKLSLLFILLIFLNIIFVFVEAAIHLLIAWDGIASWFFGGKALFIDQRLTSTFYNYANFDFPFMFQSVLAFQSSLGGKFSEASSLFLFPCIYSSILILFFSKVREYTNFKFAIVTTFLLSSTQILLRHGGYFDAGHIDILFSYFILASVVFLINCKSNFKFNLFLLLQLFLTTSVFIKNEGAIFYLLFQVLVVFTFRRRKNFRRILGLAIIFTLPLVLWMFYKHSYLPSNYRFVGSLFSFYHQIPSASVYLFGEFFNIQRWNIMWLVIFALIPSILKVKKYTPILVVMFLQLVVYILVYLVSPVDIIVHLKGSWDRLLLHVFPATLLLSVLSIDYKKLSKMLK